jgi:hypothetical protein
VTMSDVVPVRSDCCGLDDLFLAYGTGEAERARLALGPGWPRRWTATWQVPGGDVTCAVRDLASGPPAGCEPVRRFSWARRQRHRPGLQFMVSTGRLHGFRDGSRWLLDVRPARLVREDDAACFAGAAEASLEAGWRYSVVAGWRPHVLTGIDAAAEQRGQARPGHP